MDIDVKELFKNFLNENGVYEAFNNNCKNTDETSISKDEDEWFKQHDRLYGFIMDAFIWKLTPEGLSFWDNLSDSWRELLHKKNIPWETTLADEAA